MLPAAFTQQTGKDHWEVLLRARAIETETYMWPPRQTGSYKAEDGSTRLTYGHSLIADPWGHVICKASDGVGFTTGRVDTAYIEKCRKLIPVLEHKVLGTPAMPVAGRGGVGLRRRRAIRRASLILSSREGPSATGSGATGWKCKENAMRRQVVRAWAMAAFTALQPVRAV